MTELRVILVEDSVLLREGLARLVAEAGHRCVAALGDAGRLVETARETSAQLAILDVRLPPTFRDEGVRAALDLRRELPQVGVLVLSQYVETVYARELLADSRGGVGYLLKDRVTSLDEFAAAIDRVAAGGTVLDPEVVRKLLSGSADPVAALTGREREVLALIAEGHSNLGIAEKLVIGVGAVEKHVTSLFAKLGLGDDAADHRRVLAVLAYLRAR